MNKTVARIQKLSRLRPTLALVLGSGFNHVLRDLDVDARLAYSKIPGFPKTTCPKNHFGMPLTSTSQAPEIVG